MSSDLNVESQSDSLWPPSYSNTLFHKTWNYDSFRDKVLCSKEKTLSFLMIRGVIGHLHLICPKCESPMRIAKCHVENYGEELAYRCSGKHYEEGSMSKLDCQKKDSLMK
jgi:hypothetical protein